MRLDDLDPTDNARDWGSGGGGGGGGFGLLGLLLLLLGRGMGCGGIALMRFTSPFSMPPTSSR